MSDPCDNADKTINLINQMADKLEREKKGLPERRDHTTRPCPENHERRQKIHAHAHTHAHAGPTITHKRTWMERLASFLFHC